MTVPDGVSADERPSWFHVLLVTAGVAVAVAMVVAGLLHRLVPALPSVVVSVLVFGVTFQVGGRPGGPLRRLARALIETWSPAEDDDA